MIFKATVLAATLGSLLLGGVTWEFERAITRLDGIQQNTADIDKREAVNSRSIADLRPRVDALEKWAFETR